jgi:hypothetical protein
MLKKGEILSAEVLPAFARELEKQYDIKALKEVNTLIAATNRLANAWDMFTTSVFDSKGMIVRAFVGMTEAASDLLRKLELIAESQDRKEKRVSHESYVSKTEELDTEYDKELSLLLKGLEDKKKIKEATTKFNAEWEEKNRTAYLKALDDEIKARKEAEEKYGMPTFITDQIEANEKMVTALEEEARAYESISAKALSYDKRRIDLKKQLADLPTNENGAVIDMNLYDELSEDLQEAEKKYKEYHDKFLTESENMRNTVIKAHDEGITDVFGGYLHSYSEVIDKMNEKTEDLKEPYKKAIAYANTAVAKLMGITAAYKDQSSKSAVDGMPSKSGSKKKPKDFMSKELVGAYKREKEYLEGILNLNKKIAATSDEYVANRERALLRINEIETKILDNELKRQDDKDKLWLVNERSRINTYLKHSKRTAEGTKKAKYEIAIIERKLDEETLKAAEKGGIDLHNAKVGDVVSLSRLEFDYLDKLIANESDWLDKKLDKDIATAQAIFDFKMSLIDKQFTAEKDKQSALNAESRAGKGTDYAGNVMSGEDKGYKTLFTSYYRERLAAEKQYTKESLTLALQRAEAEVALFEKEKPSNNGIYNAEDQAALDKLRDDLAKAKEALAEFGVSLAEDFRNQVETVGNTTLKFVDAIGNVMSTLHDRRMADIQAEQEATDLMYEESMFAARDDADQKEALSRSKQLADRELEKKRRKANRDQAKIDKAQALINISIATSLATMRAYSDAGPFAGTGFAIAIAALGAIQAAAVAMKPLPPLKEGRQDGPAGHFLVGDGGRREIIEKKKDGSIGITPSTNTVTWLDKGDKVWKSEDAYRRSLLARASTGLTQQYDEADITEAIYKGFSKAKIDNKNIIQIPVVDINHQLWAQSQAQF